jgi:CRP-like cAMP-binding protein
MQDSPREIVRLLEGSSRPSIAYLRAQDIFQDLGADAIDTIHGITRMRRCHRGTVFFRPGDAGEQLFLLKEGRVTLYRLTPDGHKLVVGVVEAGTIFGEMAVAGQSMQECFAEAHEESLVCTITPPQMEHIFQQYPTVARRLLEVLGTRVQRLEERLEQMAYGSVRERLARFLLARTRPASDGCQVAGFTHEQLGEAVGASRQTVSLELGQLEAEGLVEVGRRRVRLVNTSALKSLAGLL